MVELVVRVPLTYICYNMEKGVQGEGFVNVHNDYDTHQGPESVTNCAYARADLIDTISSCASTSIVDTGTELKRREFGSGTYESEEQSAVRTENKSIRSVTSLSAIHKPTSFNLPSGRSITYGSKWTERSEAINTVTGATMNEEYTHANTISKNRSVEINENGTIMKTEAEFEGSGHIGVLKKNSPDAHPKIDPVYEAVEDYVGKFKVHETVEEYGKNVVSNKSASGVGYVSADKRIRDSQRTYESGTGSYQVEEKVDTASSYMYKDLQVGSRPSSFNYTPRTSSSQNLLWSEGMISKTGGSSMKGGALNRGTATYISERYTGINSMNKTTIALGLNEMKTEAAFQGTADYRAIMVGENGSAKVDDEERYVGSYNINRRVMLSGVSRYDVPHITVTHEGNTSYRWYNGTNATIATFIIHVTNDGNRALAPVMVRDMFPPGTEYIMASIKPTSLGAGEANWTLTHIGIGDTVDIQLELNVTEEAYFADLVNRVDVYGVYSDGYVNAASYAVVPVTWLGCYPPELSLDKTAEINPSDSTRIDYRIVLVNRANYTMALTIEDYLPDSLRILSASRTPDVYVAGRAKWILNTVLPGEVVTIDYVAQAVRDGQQVNKVKVRGVSVTGEGTAVAEAEASVYIKGTGSQAYTTRYDGWQPPAWDLNMTEEGWYIGDTGMGEEETI